MSRLRPKKRPSKPHLKELFEEVGASGAPDGGPGSPTAGSSWCWTGHPDWARRLMPCLFSARGRHWKSIVLPITGAHRPARRFIFGAPMHSSGRGCPQMVADIRNVFQAPNSFVQMVQGKTGCHGYSVYLSDAYIIESSNHWAEHLRRMPHSEAAWVEANQVFLTATRPLWLPKAMPPHQLEPIAKLLGQCSDISLSPSPSLFCQ